MRLPGLNRIGIVTLALLAGATGAANAQPVTAGAPVDLSVTVYRDPYRDEGGFDLDYLGGFALITEFRPVQLSPGEHTLRFEGVADGIEPASAIVTGLPSGVIEKNRDAMLLSPSALVEATADQQGRVIAYRTDPATGVTTTEQGVIRSAARGVVFETPEGIEALRCSGLPETIAFETSASGLSSTPTLSIRTRVTEPVDAIIQLSYLARGFDWSADYVADRSDAGSLDLGAWITLANSNGVSFPDARVQIVAGRLNRESGEVEPIEIGQPIFAQCWPMGTTSDMPPVLEFAKGLSVASEMSSDRVMVTASMRAPMAEDAPLPVAVFEATQEDLGDLKLYRLPIRTSVLSRQAKQVRMFDRDDIPVTRIYERNFSANSNLGYAPLSMLLRTKNTEENNLGLPLPSGRVQLFEESTRSDPALRLLAGETTLRDLTLDEEVEFTFSGGPDVQARQVYESLEISATQAGLPFLPLLRIIPGVNAGTIRLNRVNRIEVSNARPYPVDVELRLYLPAGGEVVRADKPYGQKNGRPIFRLTVPANDSLTVRYQTTSRSN